MPALQPALGPIVGNVVDPLLRAAGIGIGEMDLVVSGVGTMLLALTTHILFLILLFGGVLSIAMGGSSLTTTSALLAKWFHRQRATAVALNASGASVGGLDGHAASRPPSGHATGVDDGRPDP